jgi:hypothetical protein
MMNKATDTPAKSHFRLSLTSEAGLMFILFGILLLVDQYVHTGWISISLPFVAGLLTLAQGIVRRQVGFFIAGGLLTGIGAGVIAALNPWVPFSLQNRIGAFLLLHAIGWVLVFGVSIWLTRRFIPWALVPAGAISAGLGFWIILTRFESLMLVLYLPTSIGLALLVCGLMNRKIGLVIPGSLLLTIGPGIYYAWGSTGEINGLTQTGTMLVTFALGWGLITVFSRFIINRFIWWPLIPGGVLAMVGWGLYIGGDPNNALRFIGNTGSIGLIFFGIYLLLWRTEFRK